MKPVAIRLLLAALVAGSVGLRYHTLKARDGNDASAEFSRSIAALVATHGLRLRPNPVAPPRVLSRIVYFERPDCDQQSLAMPFQVNQETAPLLERAIDASYRRHYYYLDADWREHDRIAMYRVWLRHVVMAAIGSAVQMPARTAIVVADPATCAALDVVPWSQVWRPQGWSGSRPDGGVQTATSAGPKP